MPESRDRLVRPVDIAALYARRRFGILTDQEDELFRTPIRPNRQSTDIVLTPASFATTVTRRSFRGRNPNESYSISRGGARRGRGRRPNALLPSWYPRRPLADITVVVRAMEERRRARQREGQEEDRDSESPSQDRNQVAQLEQDQASASKISPLSDALKTSFKLNKTPLGKVVPKIVRDITSQDPDSYETPQKKLLKCIGTVEKVVMEELKKLKETPAAKRAERERRVRTLMSMR